jgi:hypothetical protein
MLTVINKAIAGDLRAVREVLREPNSEVRPEQSAPRPSLDAADELLVEQWYTRNAQMQKGLANGTDDPS